MEYKGNVGLIRLFLLLVIVFICAGGLYSFTFSPGEKETVNLQTLVVSDFGNDVDQSNNIKWDSKFSRFAKPADPNKEMSEPDTNACGLTYIQAKPLGLPQYVESKQKWSLGIKAQFIRKGYNWIEVFPIKAGSESQVSTGSNSVQNQTVQKGQNNPLILPGEIKSLDMWVWGGNYKYWLEFYLTDYKGFLHRLSAGDISYIGWKNIRTKIPDYIPQAEYHVPFLKSLSLQMIKLWAYPSERVDQFYCYFNYLQVQTDVYVERFNGDDLANNRW